MKKFNRALLGGIALVAIGTAAPAFAGQEWHPYYHGYSVKHGAPLTAEQKLELHKYTEYEEREPCQNYREPPVGFVRDHCTLMYPIPVAEPAPQYTVTETVTTQTTMKSIAEYNVYFDFDKSDLRPGDIATLDRVAREINTYQPTEVTVAGHTDRSGSYEYNYALSQRRAQAVSAALTERGVVNRVIQTEAHGETQPAVATPDGVKLEENRRVEIDFMK